MLGYFEGNFQGIPLSFKIKELLENLNITEYPVH